MADNLILSSVNRQVGETNRWLRAYQAAHAQANTQNSDDSGTNDTTQQDSNAFPWGDLLNGNGLGASLQPLFMMLMLQMLMAMFSGQNQNDPFQGFPVYWPNGPLTSLVPPVINPFQRSSTI